MIKAVIFDYFGVLSSDEYWRAMGGDSRTGAAFHSLAQEVNLGHITWHDFVARVAEQAGKSPEQLGLLYQAERLNPELLAYVASLKPRYKLGLITNAHHEFLEPILAEAHLDTLFDSVVMSSHLGITKPDPRIFRAALDELDVQPQEAVFIDDIASNADGAARAGLHAITYHSLEQFQAELATLLDDAVA